MSRFKSALIWLLIGIVSGLLVGTVAMNITSYGCNVAFVDHYNNSYSENLISEAPLPPAFAESFHGREGTIEMSITDNLLSGGLVGSVRLFVYRAENYLWLSFSDYYVVADKVAELVYDSNYIVSRVSDNGDRDTITINNPIFAMQEDSLYCFSVQVTTATGDYHGFTPGVSGYTRETANYFCFIRTSDVLGSAPVVVHSVPDKAPLPSWAWLLIAGAGGGVVGVIAIAVYQIVAKKINKRRK